MYSLSSAFLPRQRPLFLSLVCGLLAACGSGMGVDTANVPSGGAPATTAASLL